MPRFFTGEIEGMQARIVGEDARHIALSLRMKAGEQITVCDAKGLDYQCEISTLHPDEVMLRVCEVCSSAGEPNLQITLFQALPKGDKMELIVQKAVELGAFEIVPIITERCVSRPDVKTMSKKQQRYQKISLEAAKQCGRGRIPQVAEMMHFPEVLSKMKQFPLGIFFYENANTSLKRALQDKKLSKIAIMVGCEGGFSCAEAQQAREAGMLMLSLGSRILRCETAPLAALTAILYEAGEI